jgi:hypothetical protein
MRTWTVVGCTVLLAFGLAVGVYAGSVSDIDGDGVPDDYDNCLVDPNGPLRSSSSGIFGGFCDSQEDYNRDGYGQPCDADVDNTGNILGGDITIVLRNLNSPGELVTDLDCSGNTMGSDLIQVLFSLAVAPGPSGLACAGSIPCP